MIPSRSKNHFRLEIIGHLSLTLGYDNNPLSSRRLNCNYKILVADSPVHIKAGGELIEFSHEFF